MNVTILTALISGTFAVLAPIITLLVTRKYDNRDLQPMSQGRRTALTGMWQGQVHQDKSARGEGSEYPIFLELSTSNKVVRGTATLESQQGVERFVCELSGGFYHDRFLRMNYANRDKTAIQFGTLMFELSAKGKKLRGKFVGYGSMTEDLVSGTVDLEKAA